MQVSISFTNILSDLRNIDLPRFGIDRSIYLRLLIGTRELHR